MRSLIRVVLLFAVFSLVAVSSAQQASITAIQIVQNYGTLPLAFEANQGQTDVTASPTR